MVETIPVGFEAFDLNPEIARAIQEIGYEEPTPVQQAAIPIFRAGQDLIAQAQTGTGKTAAFGIPIVEAISPSAPGVQALILAPTRELATQIVAELTRLAKYRDVGICAVYGGSSMKAQIDAIPHASIVVGTPGRILDLMRRGHLRLASVSVLVLDEADRMLDMGFLPDVEQIIRATPRARQTGLFSATITTLVRRLAARYMRDPQHVTIAPEERTVATVRQLCYEVANRDKMAALFEVIEREEPRSAIIFCHTQVAVDRVAREMQRRRLPVRAIHGSLSQAERERTLQDFRAGKVHFLVATNLASRGLDILHVSHVINYDIPEDAETYVHRIGRTARMGRHGTAITFVSEWDLDAFEAIKKVAGDNLEPAILDLYAVHR
ncbi:MAG TPA: DEAD/DEAH box helicase [Chloroflexota bacterium]|nr:DEAD/DEAH box helicase [Chloroflexota bacterium]